MTETRLVGAALSLSGRFAVQGQQARRGLELWAEHVNRAGGLVVERRATREPVELRIYDDASRRAGAAEATERLIMQDRVSLLFSPYSSVLAIAAAEVAQRYGRLLWNHGGSSDALDARGWRHVITLLTPASRYFTPVLDLAVQHANALGRPARTVALRYGASGTFPQAVISGARAHAARLGLTVVLDEPYPPLTSPSPPTPIPCAGEGAGGDRQLVGRLPAPSQWGVTSAQPMFAPRSGGGGASPRPGSASIPQADIILGVGTTEADLAFARELHQQQVQAHIVGLVAAPIEQFRQELGVDADGFCGPSQWEPTLQGQPDLGPTTARFCADFRERYGLEPDYPAAQAYAAGLIAAHSAEIATSCDDDALKRAVAGLDLTTFYGRFRVDPDSMRQIGHEMVVAQWQDSRRQIVWPPDTATAPPRLPFASRHADNLTSR